MTQPDEDGVRSLVGHLFRREAGRLTASLTRSLGPARLALAEESVQEAMMRALKRWPFHGIPDKPEAWLYRVARNQALDRLRRETGFKQREDLLREVDRTASPEARFEDELTDDQLRLIFLCCHPELSRDARVALTLKAVAGFSVAEIARAFLTREATIAQRLVRAQRRIRERRIPFEVPSPEELPERLDTVLEAIYLLFNEGYGRHVGSDLVAADICLEALRLCEQLTRSSPTRNPSVHALASLLAFQSSRLPARVDRGGELVRLEDQDRNLWDRGLTARAFFHLERASVGERLTSYHLQAAIAAHHAVPDAAATDWQAILKTYDLLLDLRPTPIVALNRAVAVAHVHDARAGLKALDEIVDAPEDYYLLPAVRADLLRRLGRFEEARASYLEASACSCSEPEKRFLRRRLNEIEGELGTGGSNRAGDARKQIHVAPGVDAK